MQTAGTAPLPASSTTGAFALDPSMQQSREQVNDAMKLLRKWNLEISSENLQKYFTLKRTLGDSRVTLARFQQSTSKRSHGESHERLLYVVPRHNPQEPEVDEFLRHLPPRCIVRPELLHQHPEDLDPSTVYFVTPNVDRTRLGSQHTEHRTIVANKVSSSNTSSASQPLALPPSGSAPSAFAATPEAVPPSQATAGDEPPPAKKRQLLARNSDSGEGKVRDEFEEIADRTLAAANGGHSL